MTDIKSNQQDTERAEINWKSDVYSQHSMNNYIQQLATSPGNREQLTKIVGISSNVPNHSDNLDKEESDSLSGYSDDENHKRKQRRYR